MTEPTLSASELADRMSRMFQVLAGDGVPGDTEAFALPDTGSWARTPGATAPVFVRGYVMTSSGLLIPQRYAIGPQPVDFIKVFITAKELLGYVPDRDLLVNGLRGYPLERVIEYVASGLIGLAVSGNDTSQLDRQFAQQLADAPRHRAMAMLAEENPKRVLIAAQPLFALLKAAFCLSPDTAAGDPRPAFLPALLVSFSDYLGTDEDVAELTVTGAPGPLARELISNQLFNSGINHVDLIGRFERRWFELPAERATEERVVDMAAEFEYATGVALRDFIFLGVLFWVNCYQERPRLGPGYVAATGWEPERLQRALDLFIASLDQMRALVQEEVADGGMSWSISSFEQYPVVRMSDGGMLVIDPKLVLRRVCGLLPMFDIEHGLKVRGETKRLARVWESYRYLAEQYALELLRELVTTRLYTEDELAVICQGKRADASVDYGDAWIVVEVTTSRPTRGTVSGEDAAAADKDLGKLVKKVAQLDATITALREKEAVLTGHPGADAPRFYPVLVTADGFPVNPFTLELIRERVTRAGLLVGNDVARLELLDLEDLELVLALHEAGGPTLRELLRDRETAGPIGNVGLKEYVLGIRRPVPRHSAHLDEARARLFQSMRPPADPAAA